MNLFNELSKDDVNLLHRYISEYGDTNKVIGIERMDYFLRYWSNAKEKLYKMFDNNFIIKKQIKFTRPVGEMKDELYDKIDHYSGNAPSNLFQRDMFDFIHGATKISGKEYANLREKLYFLITNYQDFVNNSYSGSTFIVPAELTKDNKEIQVPTGCKPVKILGKIAKAFEIDAHYEDFRQAHSQVLNQKVVMGTLCLSIHPLDYLTMSDNDCDWTSCMRWIDDPGDYRLGTIEMMSSPCVVVAYLESKTPFEICGGSWSNKKWRQLYIITPEMILGNKQYPYDNDELQGAVISWLRTLANSSLGYGPYDEEAYSIVNGRHNTIKNKEVYFNIGSNYMYNDVYGHKMAYLASDRLQETYYLNFSGVPTCIECGEEIELESVESHMVNCCSCEGGWRCSDCGDYCTGHQYWVDDCCYCEYCYENLPVCSVCGETVSVCSHIPIFINPETLDANGENEFADFNGRYYVGICDYCVDEESFTNYGKVHLINAPYYQRKVFNLKEFTEEGIDRLELPSWHIKKLLKDLLKAPNDKTRLKLIKENLIF